MDLRVEKTIKSIFNTFLEMRAKNPLEKISVTELSEKAMINKATFYLHFKDIYDLSDCLESELVNSIIDKISPNEFVSDPVTAIDTLTEAYAAKKKHDTDIVCGYAQPAAGAESGRRRERTSFRAQPDVERRLCEKHADILRRVRQLLRFCQQRQILPRRNDTLHHAYQRKLKKSDLTPRTIRVKLY